MIQASKIIGTGLATTGLVRRFTINYRGINARS